MTTYISKSVEVDVEVDVDDIIDELSEKEKADLAIKLMSGAVPFGLGEGDVARGNNIIERAFMCVKCMESVPRELQDLFWFVHGRAL